MIRKLIPDDGGLDFQHLRRFAKFADVPVHVRDSLDANTQAVLPKDEGEPPRLLLIVGPVSAISLIDLTTVLSTSISGAIIVTVEVPLLAPTSQEQAKTWTSRYWPTVYKKSNPFGPHPSIVSRAENEIRDEVEKWMDLAHDVAIEANEARYGEKIGVVVVERKAGKAKIVAVAGDSRWKGCTMPERGDGGGNVTAHAVMRVVGMVAGALKTRDKESRGSSELPNNSTIVDIGGTNGLRGSTSDISKDSNRSAVLNGENDKNYIPDPGVDETVQSKYANEPRSRHPAAEIAADSAAMHEEPPKVSASDWTAFKPPSGIIDFPDNDIFLDRPLLSLEKEHFDPHGNQNGYLCHDLEIYCTHEPCVMCSMAIVHSRFGKVVFQERMTRTGGMCADSELGHGLAWRKELNWTLLAWHWRTALKEDTCELHA